MEREKQLLKACPTHNKGNTIISVKHMERIFVGSKGSLWKIMHATVTKRKDSLSIKLTAQGSTHPKETSGFCPLEPFQALMEE